MEAEPSLKELKAAIIYLAEGATDPFDAHFDAVAYLWGLGLAEWRSNFHREFSLTSEGQAVYENLISNQPVSTEMWNPHGYRKSYWPNS